MTGFIRLSVLAAATAALVACGGSGAKLGGGKEGAAKALVEASQPAAKGGNGNLLQAIANGAASLGAEVKVDCAKSGSVTLKLDVTSIGQTSGSFKYNLEYNGCSQDGINEFDGDMSMEFSVSTNGTTSASIAMRLKGKIEISGEIDDFVDADVTETIDVSATGATTGSVTVKMSGSIKTSSESFTYDGNTPLTITVGGGLPAAADGNS
jgi:hypothetical protein